MAARVVISCDGTWDDGRMPCRGAYPATALDGLTATYQAVLAGWEHENYSELHPLGRHYCPAHARKGPKR